MTHCSVDTKYTACGIACFHLRQNKKDLCINRGLRQKKQLTWRVNAVVQHIWPTHLACAVFSCCTVTAPCVYHTVSWSSISTQMLLALRQLHGGDALFCAMRIVQCTPLRPSALSAAQRPMPPHPPPFRGRFHGGARGSNHGASKKSEKKLRKVVDMAIFCDILEGRRVGIEHYAVCGESHVRRGGLASRIFRCCPSLTQAGAYPPRMRVMAS